MNSPLSPLLQLFFLQLLLGDTDSSGEESRMVDCGLPRGHSGGVFQDTRAHSVEVLHTDSVIEERHGVAHRPRPVAAGGQISRRVRFLVGTGGGLRDMAVYRLVRLLLPRLGALRQHEVRASARHRAHGRGLPSKEVPFHPILLGDAHRPHPLPHRRRTLLMVVVLK